MEVVCVSGLGVARPKKSRLVRRSEELMEARHLVRGAQQQSILKSQETACGDIHEQTGRGVSTHEKYDDFERGEIEETIEPFQEMARGHIEEQTGERRWPEVFVWTWRDRVPPDRGNMEQARQSICKAHVLRFCPFRRVAVLTRRKGQRLVAGASTRGFC